jgi:hypothetical protein
VIFARRRADAGPVPVPERWRQVFETGEAELHPFSQAELDAVALEPGPEHPTGGLPYLQRLSPVLVQAATLAAMRSDPLPGGDWDLQPGPDLTLDARPGAMPAQDPSASAAGMSELAAAVAGLEDSGFVRPAPPAPPKGQMPVEFAGLAAVGEGRPPRRVALTGDLGLITYMMCRPLFVAEFYRAADPTRPDLASSGWQLVARGYTPYEMPGCLIERPSASPAGMAQRVPPGAQPPRAILREDQAAAVMLAWLGGDATAYLKLRAARAAQPGEPTQADLPGQLVPTATVAARFSQLARLSLIVPEGREVVLRALAVGTGAGGHWLLTGEQLELAAPVTLGQLGDRLDDMLANASRPAAAVPPSGPDAGPPVWPDAGPPVWPDGVPPGWSGDEPPGGQDAW